ncbi:MAG: acetylxylan esterase [Planctomycetota bacterium]|nr:acetylxylan esterase [Planctomycetota bacterium]
MTLRLTLTAAVVLLMANPSHAQFNYDEAKVPKFTLPDPLVTSAGEKVISAEQWAKQRRPEILELFESQVYGRSPAAPKGLVVKQTDIDTKALGGKATRKQVTVYLTGENDGPQMSILIYIPNNRSGPAPVFLGLNFLGNHAVHADPAIHITKSWTRNDPKRGYVDNKATEKSRGAASSRWAVDMIVDRGYAIATIYYGDIDPDFHDGFKNGIHPHFYVGKQTEPKADEWGSIAAWSWGLSRALDYFQQDDDIDHKHVAVIGHSRLGKTSLWAGAGDPRFAMVISNNSGCGGAALSRRAFGETVKRINTSFPHWFCGNYKKYNDKEDDCPVDQHMLIALIAPRPVYIASAHEDRWADPRGEFLSGLYADPVYRLLGTDGIGADKMPEIDKPVQNTIGYHIRTGKHDVTDFDWTQYLKFADKHFRKASR